jgi:hypothetical protein
MGGDFSMPTQGIPIVRQVFATETKTTETHRLELIGEMRGELEVGISTDFPF